MLERLCRGARELLRRVENVIQRCEQINRLAAARGQIEEDMIPPTQAGV
jgi:hypothetical protein